MVDSPRDPVTRDAPGTPTWVKALGIAAIFVALLVVVVMIATGGQHGPGQHTVSNDVDAQAPAASGPGVAPDIGGPVDADGTARTIAVTTLDTMVFEPSGIEVSAGEVVTFVVTNAGQAVHEFTLGDAAMQQEHANAMTHLPAGMAHDLPNSITLQPGETRQLAWRFGDPGTLEYACHEPGHYDGGMRGHITVV